MLASIALIALARQTGPQPHPAFMVTSNVIKEVFEKGQADAKKYRGVNEMLMKFGRGIGSVRLNAMGSKQTVSYLWAFPPQFKAYGNGVMSKKQFWSDQQIQDKFTEWLKDGDHPAEKLHCEGIIRLYPSFGAGYGKIDRRADPADLSDVRVVLQVGDKIYQPEAQPGKLEAASGTAANVVTTPESSSSTTDVSVHGTGGYANATATTTNVYYTHTTENYDWYEGNFKVDFPLKNEDGTYRITDADKSIEIIVVYGSNERHVKYDLKDFLFTNTK